MFYEDHPNYLDHLEDARIDYYELFEELHGERPRNTSAWTLDDFSREYLDLIQLRHQRYLEEKNG